ncbi:unnamed protein product [Lymnaea stagnalis]|uniref:Uncharacterized protein n=1 Tax=Lymnaea stagnalis TaxID=6523 RepID=A0AAV2ICX4_LYMST
MARQCDVRFFPSIYSSEPEPSDFILGTQTANPYEETRLRLVTRYPPETSIHVLPIQRDEPVVITGHMRPLGDCTMFEQPYFSPNYIQMPTNYMRRPHHWVDRRITLDDLSRWANESVRHERAFGGWHNVFGTRYFYGEDRRL